MNFKDLLIKKSYINQGTDNFVDCLLNPALKLAKTYRRSVGFFSSSVFKLIINALPSFIRNGGRVNLIVSPSLSEDDIAAIQLGYERKEDLINRRFFEDFNSEIKCFDDASLEVLSELVARDILDIKVASVKNDVGIYHDKLGILIDKDDNKIVFYLYNLGIKSSQFTATESMDRRMELVDMFNNNEVASLVAIRCLDEGINIPSIKSALILSSNDDYREFVQRRGRILRKYGDKKSADIYDVIVLPSGLTPKMAVIELRRYYEYARLALNHDGLLAQLDALLNEYNLTLDDVMFYTEINTEVDLDD